MKYILQEKTCKEYFVDPSYQSWSFTDNIEEATTFDDIQEAFNKAHAVNVASLHTFWEHDEITPKAIVIPR